MGGLIHNSSQFLLISAPTSFTFSSIFFSSEQHLIEQQILIIIVQCLTQNPTDHNEFLKMVILSEHFLGFKPRVVVADNIYLQDYLLEWAKEKDIRVNIPDRAESTKSKQKKC